MLTDSQKKELEKEGTRLFAILDGASVPDLPMKLYKSGLPHHCLFSTEQDPDMTHVAPHLVFLPPGNQFTEWIFSEGLGKHWGIFAQSRSSMVDLRGHFRSLLDVYDENANALTFRYYDPRVLGKFLPSCNAGELRVIFGNVDAYFAESRSGDKLYSYQIDGGGLKTAEVV